MTYKVYLTVEMTGEYATLEAAQEAAIATLQAAPKQAKQARVFDSEHAMLSGDQHAFIVDIYDGCM